MEDFKIERKKTGGHVIFIFVICVMLYFAWLPILHLELFGFSGLQQASGLFRFAFQFGVPVYLMVMVVRFWIKFIRAKKVALLTVSTESMEYRSYNGKKWNTHLIKLGEITRIDFDGAETGKAITVSAYDADPFVVQVQKEFPAYPAIRDEILKRTDRFTIQSDALVAR